MTEEQIRQLSRWKRCCHCANLSKFEAKNLCKRLMVRLDDAGIYEKHGCILYTEEAPTEQED